MPSFIFKGLHRRSAFENCHLQFLPSSSAARRRSQLGLSKVFPGICGTRRIFLGDQWHPSIWGGVGVLADSIEIKGRTIYCCLVVSNHPKKQPRPMLEILFVELRACKFASLVCFVDVLVTNPCSGYASALDLLMRGFLLCLGYIYIYNVIYIYYIILYYIILYILYYIILYYIVLYYII